MTYEESPRRGLRLKILAAVNRFPENRRQIWLDEILTELKIDPSGPAWTSLIEGRKGGTVTSDTADELPTALVQRLLKRIVERAEAVRQARWVRFTLQRATVSTHWRDLLLDALSSPEIVTSSQNHPELASWIAATYQINRPPDLTDVIPPLKWDEIKRIRQHVDRSAKRYMRRSAWHNPQQLDLVDAATSRTDRAEVVIDSMILLTQLSETDRRVLYLRYIEGLSFAEIGSELGVSLATAYRLLLTAAVNARRVFKIESSSENEPSE